MDIFTKQDLSLNYWIQELFTDTPFIKVVDGFPLTNLYIPSIAIENDDIDSSPFELGNKKRLYLRSWNIDIFAKNKAQRDECSYRILVALEDSIPVYDFDVSFPTETAPPYTYPLKLGCLLPLDFRLKVIKVIPELVSDLYYRASISLQTEYSVF